MITHEIAQRVQRPAIVDPAWPIVALTVGMPVAYVAGLTALVWILPAIVFGFALVRSRSVRVPAAAVPLLALTAWVLLTVVQVSGTTAVPLFFYRWMLWVSTVASMLWLANGLSVRVSSARIVRLLAALWIVLVVFGYLAMIFPDVHSRSMVQALVEQYLGRPLARPSFLYDLTVIRFAEVQEFVGHVVPRPAAPMAYTNGWGSTIGLLTPFFACSWLMSPGRLRRNVGIVLAVAAAIPVIVSTDRGLWLSVGVAVVYLGIRRAIAGDARALVAIALVGALVVTLTMVSPLGQTVHDRFSGVQASNATRERLYATALTQTKQSPLLGFGAPETVERGPAIGTHGLMWYVMFAHGFPGLIMLFGAAAALLFATRRPRTKIALWSHLAIVVFAVQIPFYGLFPQIVLVGFAAGLAWRENHAAPAEAADPWR